MVLLKGELPMLTATTWMTASQARDAGFVHAVKAGPNPPPPFWSDGGFAASVPADVLASVRAPAHLIADRLCQAHQISCSVNPVFRRGETPGRCRFQLDGATA